MLFLLWISSWVLSNSVITYFFYFLPIGGELLPRELTWNPKMEGWKMIFLFKQVIFRFHVSFRGSILLLIRIFFFISHLSPDFNFDFFGDRFLLSFRIHLDLLTTNYLRVWRKRIDVPLQGRWGGWMVGWDVWMFGWDVWMFGWDVWMFGWDVWMFGWDGWMFGWLDGMFGCLDGMFGCLDGMFGWLVSPSGYQWLPVSESVILGRVQVEERKNDRWEGIP